MLFEVLCQLLSEVATSSSTSTYWLDLKAVIPAEPRWNFNLPSVNPAAYHMTSPLQTTLRASLMFGR